MKTNNTVFKISIISLIHDVSLDLLITITKDSLFFLIKAYYSNQSP